MSIYKAFTLAEVLITLGIIGIVAALTMPALISNHEKSVVETRLKKSYADLSQIVKLSEAHNEEIIYWDFSLSIDNFLDKYIYPFLKKGTTWKNVAMVNNIRYNSLNGQINTTMYSYTTTYPKMASPNGTLFVFAKNGNGVVVYVDINGLAKPNKIGRDLFIFAIDPDRGGVVPYGLGDKVFISQTFGGSLERSKIKCTNQNSCCNKSSMGYWCSALIMHDGWKIKDDYPW